MKEKFEFRYFDEFDEIKDFANSYSVRIIQIMPCEGYTFYKYVVFYYIIENSKN